MTVMGTAGGLWDHHAPAIGTADALSDMARSHVLHCTLGWLLLRQDIRSSAEAWWLALLDTTTTQKEAAMKIHAIPVAKKLIIF